MNILVSGGHLTPALALIDRLKQTHPEVTVVFAGRSQTQKSTGQPAHEYRLVTERTNTVFEHFDSGKWGVGNVFYKIKQIGLLGISLPKAIGIVYKYKPKVFVSFGGYLAVPLAFAAKLLGVPVITHEQTRTAGLSNQVIAKIADQVAVSYKESLDLFPKNKTVLTGNLIRSTIKKATKTPDWFRLKNPKPILYITGGSQGSEVINNTVAQVLPQLLKEFVVIHQCGPKSRSRNYLKELELTKQKLPLKLRSHYFVKEWIEEADLAWIYNQAILVIGRAGANTVSELKLNALPAILIPLAIAHNDEQRKNALSLVEAGGAVIINQSDLNPETLIQTLDQVKPNLKQMKANLKKLPKEKDGVLAFEKLLEKYLK